MYYKEITIEDFKLLIRWLDASGDFKDEVIRLNGWKAFLDTKDKVYSKKFLNSSKKLIFVPVCMRQIENECLSKKGNKGYKCTGCSSHCNVNILRKIGQTHNAKIYIIPHDTLLSNLESEGNNATGIIGVACVLNLVSG